METLGLRWLAAFLNQPILFFFVFSIYKDQAEGRDTVAKMVVFCLVLLANLVDTFFRSIKRDRSIRRFLAYSLCQGFGIQALAIFWTENFFPGLIFGVIFCSLAAFFQVVDSKSL